MSDPRATPADGDPAAATNTPWRDQAATAITTDGLRWTYRTLAEKIAARAAVLHAQGLGEGQLVACPAGTTDAGAVELVLMQHALAQCGAALLPLAPAAANHDALLAATGCEWLWQPDHEPSLGTLRATGHRPPPSIWPGDRLALVVQTSGSSGEPKAVMLGARALLASRARVNARLDLRAGDRWLAVLPRQHIGGLTIGGRCALAGATLHLHGRFDAQRLAQDLQRHPITHLSLVPPMLSGLLERLVAPPPALRAVLLGGQALERALARRAIAAGWPLYTSYGMTETGSGIAIAGPLTTLPSDGLAATPLPDVELDCPRCTATPASIRLRGPMLMAGLANPQRTPGDGLEDGWLSTADLGCRDADGRLRVIGRADAVVVIGGVNVQPDQVAQRCRDAPGIDDCAVTAIAEPTWGHRLVLIYQGPADPAALARWCRAELPSPQRPRGFIPIATIPHLASGKPDRKRLAQIAQANRTGTTGLDG